MDPIDYPDSLRHDVVDELHGVRVADPYRWLENPQDPAVRAWMDAQDRLARARLDGMPVRAALAARLRELIYVESVGVPTRRGGRYFYARKHADKEKGTHYWRAAQDGDERLLLDPNTMSGDGSLSVSQTMPSRDGRWLAYSISERGRDEATLHVREVATGAEAPADVIAGARYAVPEWLPDGSGFYYTRLPTDPSIPVDRLPGHAEVRFHALGTPAAEDPLVHPATNDPTRFIAPSLSRDGRWLLVYIQRGWSATDVFFLDRAAVGPDRGAVLPFRPLVAGVDALFSVLPFGDTFYVWTNDGAPKGRVFRVDPERPARADWELVVPERADATLEGAQIIGGRLVLQYSRDVHSELRVHALDGRFEREIALPGLGMIWGISGEEDDDEAFFGFTSFGTPLVVFRTSVATGAPVEWARAKVPIDPGLIEVRQDFYPSKDGTAIPLFIVRKKGAKEPLPTLLTGYGGFNVAVPPYFSPLAYAWVERGGAFVSTNLRGGNEYGEAWHRAGMRENKPNVFDDFLAAAEWLIGNGITTRERLAISGGSNGGLLVAAAMVQRPDLFRAVVCSVPLLDMVRYHRFGSGRTWIDEYGSADDPEIFPVLLAYSPYHNVAEGVRYPATLMLSADNDDRVDPLHARKMTAALQHAQAAAPAERPVLLRIERNAGHAGADLRKQTVEEYADILAFLDQQISG